MQGQRNGGGGSGLEPPAPGFPQRPFTRAELEALINGASFLADELHDTAAASALAKLERMEPSDG